MFVRRKKSCSKWISAHLRKVWSVCVFKLYCGWKLSQTFGTDDEKWHIKMTEEMEGKYKSALREKPWSWVYFACINNQSLLSAVQLIGHILLVACFGYFSVFHVRLESTKAILLTKCWIEKPIYLMVKNNTFFLEMVDKLVFLLKREDFCDYYSWLWVKN